MPRRMEEEFMRRAIKLARDGMKAGDGGPFGAVIVRDGQIIGEGWNRVLATNDPTAHGEIVAIRDACSKTGSHILEGCVIHTTGQPCPMCLGAIHWARISEIRYGFDVDDAASLGFDDREFFRQFTLPAGSRAIPESQLAREEALALAAEYQAMPHKPIY